MAFTDSPYTPGNTAGIKIGDGKVITLLESELVQPTRTGELVNKGDPVIGNNIVGIAKVTVTAATQFVSIDLEGVFDMAVVGSDGNGTKAGVIGDIIYIAPATAILSLDSEGVPFAILLTALAASASSAVVPIALGAALVSGGPAQVQDVFLTSGLHTTAANILTGFTFGRPVQVISWITRVTVATTGAVLFTFEKAAVDLTETQVVATAQAIGVVVVTPITTTVEGTFSATDALDIESDGTPSAGEVAITARVINLSG